MPFYTLDPIIETESILFSWRESESLTGQTINYDLELATTPEFTAGTVIETIAGISDTNYRLDWDHPIGTYYFKVTARDSADPQNNWMNSLDSSIQLDNFESANGVRSLYVNIDGTDPQPPQESVSNPISETSVIIDGNSIDWNNLVAFPNDPNDIENNNLNVIDWKSVSVAHSDNSIYFLYENYGVVNTDGSTFIPWGWQVYIDSDNNPNTGYQYSAVIGADFIIEGSSVERYIGTGTNWSWATVGSATAEMTNSIREFSFPRSWLGSTTDMKLVFQGANESYGGSTTDLYPDGALTGSSTTKSFSYSFGTVTPPDNQAPVATGQRLSLVENTTATITLSATDVDQDPLTLVITQQPSQGTLAVNTNSLTVSYTPNVNFQGADSFTYKVNDGELDSNSATVMLEVVPVQTNEGISNPVAIGNISIDGNNSDWNNLTMFDSDPADIATNVTNPIDWLSAGMAHSINTVYLTYQNKVAVKPNEISGSSILWGWQTFIDSDRNSATGYVFNGEVGAEYLIEGRRVYQYAGAGGDWEWIQLGVTELRFIDNIVELSFPRSWLTQLNTVNLAFYGNNIASGGNTQDNYPNQGSFTYSFDGIGEFGETVEVASLQRQSSPLSHQPVIANQPTAVDNNTNDNISETESNSGGGSFSWFVLFASMMIFRKRIQMNLS